MSQPFVPSRKPRLLLVDNNPKVRADLERNFSDQGYLVEAPSIAPGFGQTFVQHARGVAAEFRPHVALIDLRLNQPSAEDDHNRDDLSGLHLAVDLAFDGPQGNRPYHDAIDLAFQDPDTFDPKAYLRQAPPTLVTRKAHCILHSGYLMNYTLLHVLQALGIGWLEKPLRMNILYNEVDQAMRETCAAWRRGAAEHQGFQVDWPKRWSSEEGTRALSEAPPKLPVNLGLPDDLVSRLFPDDQVHKVLLETIDKRPRRSSPVSQRRSLVFKAWPVPRLQPAVVKLAAAADVAREANNYRQYVSGNLGGLRYTVLATPEPVTFYELGGLAYNFLGAVAAQALPSLSQYYGTHEPDHILQPLADFFRHVWFKLYDERRLLPHTLFAEYDALYDLTGRLRPAHKVEEWITVAGVGKVRNPVYTVLEDGPKGARFAHSRAAVTHGDLHGDNLFIFADAGGRPAAWAIDFERTGWGPMLRDFVELEGDILTRLCAYGPKTLSTKNLRPYHQLATALYAAPRLAWEATPAPVAAPSLVKAYHVVRGLREILVSVLPGADLDEYLWSLLFNVTFIAARFTDADQRARATCLGAVLAERLVGG